MYHTSSDLSPTHSRRASESPLNSRVSIGRSHSISHNVRYNGLNTSTDELLLSTTPKQAKISTINENIDSSHITTTTPRNINKKFSFISNTTSNDSSANKPNDVTTTPKANKKYSFTTPSHVQSHTTVSAMKSNDPPTNGKKFSFVSNQDNHANLPSRSSSSLSQSSTKSTTSGSKSQHDSISSGTRYKFVASDMSDIAAKSTDTTARLSSGSKIPIPRSMSVINTSRSHVKENIANENKQQNDIVATLQQRIVQLEQQIHSNNKSIDPVLSPTRSGGLWTELQSERANTAKLQHDIVLLTQQLQLNSIKTPDGLSNTIDLPFVNTNDSNKCSVTALHTQLNELRHRLQQSEREHDVALTISNNSSQCTHQIEIDQLHQQLHDTNITLTEFNTLSVKLSTTNKQLQQQIDELNMQHKLQLQSLNHQLDALHAESDVLKLQLEQNESLHCTELIDIRKRYELQLRDQTNRIELQAVNMTQLIEQIETQSEQHKSIVDELNHSNTVLQQQLDDIRLQHIAHVSSINEQYHHELNNVTQQHQQIMDALKLQHSNELDVLSHNNELFDQRLNALVEQHNNRLEQQRIELTDIHAAAMSHQQTQHDEQIAGKIQSMVEQHQSAVEQVRDELISRHSVELNSLHHDKQRTVEQQQQQIDELTAKHVIELSQVKQKLDIEYKSLIDAMTTQHQSALNNHISSVELLNQQISVIQLQHSNEIDELKQKHADALHQNNDARLNELIVQHSAQIHSINEKHDMTLAQHQSNHEKVRQTHDEQMDQLKHELHDKQEYIGNLHARHAAELNSVMQKMGDTTAEHQLVVDTMKQQHQVQWNQHESTVQSMNQQLSTLQQQHNSELAQLTAQHNIEVDSIRSISEQTVAAINEQHNLVNDSIDQRINELQAQHNMALHQQYKQLTDQHTAAYNELTGRHQSSAEQLQQTHQTQMDSVRRELNDQQQKNMDQLNTAHTAEITHLVERSDHVLAEHRLIIDNMTQLHQAQLAEQNSSVVLLQQQLGELQHKHSNESAAVQSRHEQTVQSMTQQHNAELNQHNNELIVKHQDEMKALTAEHQSFIEQLQTSHTAQIDALTARHTADRNQMVEEHHAAISSVELQHTTHLSNNNQLHQQPIDELTRQLRETQDDNIEWMKSMVPEHQKYIEQLQQSHSEQTDTVISELDNPHTADIQPNKQNDSHQPPIDQIHDGAQHQSIQQLYQQPSMELMNTRVQGTSNGGDSTDEVTILHESYNKTIQQQKLQIDSLSTELCSTVAQHQSSLIALKQTLLQQHEYALLSQQNVINSLTQQLSLVRSEHTNELNNITLQHNTDIQLLHSRHSNEINDVEQTMQLQQDMNSMNQQQSMDQNKSDHELQLERITQQHNHDLHKLQLELCDAAVQYDQIKLQHSVLCDQYATLQTEHKHTVDQLTQQAVGIQTQAEQDNSTYQQQIVLLQQQINELNVTHQTDIDSLRVQLSNQQLHGVTAQYNTLQSKSEEVTAIHTALMEQQKSTIRSLNQQLPSVDGGGQIDSIKQLQLQHQAELTQLIDEHTTILCESNAQHDSDIQGLRKLYEHEHQQHTIELSQQIMFNSELRTELDVSHSDMELLKHQYNEQLIQYQYTIDTLRESIQQQNIVPLTDNQDAIPPYQSQVCQLNQQLTQQAQQYQQQINVLNYEIEQLQDQLSNSNTVYENRITELQQQLTAMTPQCNTTAPPHCNDNNSNVHVTELTQRLTDLTDQYNRSVTQNQLHTNTIDQLNYTINSYTTQINTLNQQIEILQSADTQMYTVSDNVSECNDSATIELLQQQLSTLTQQFTAEHTSLKQQIKSIKIAHSQTQQQLQILQITNQHGIDERNQLNNTIQQLNVQLHSLQQQYDLQCIDYASIQSITDECNTYKQQLTELQYRYIYLQEQYDTTLQQYTLSQSTVTDLNTQLTTVTNQYTNMVEHHVMNNKVPYSDSELNEQMKLLQDQLINVKQNNKTLLNHNTRLKAQLYDVTSQITDIKQSMDSVSYTGLQLQDNTTELKRLQQRLVFNYDQLHHFTSPVKTKTIKSNDINLHQTNLIG